MPTRHIITATEAVTWYDASTPPDDDTTVLLHHPRLNEPVWPGYHQGGEWWTAEGQHIDAAELKGWAHMLTAVAAPAPAEPGGIARRKRDGLITDGYVITGWLLSKPGERHALMHQAAVRWLTSDDLWALMHIPTSQVVPGQAAEAPCEWRLSDRADGIWTASCSDLLYSFADGGPIENGHKHCHGCGRVLVVAADQEGGAA